MHAQSEDTGSYKPVNLHDRLDDLEHMMNCPQLPLTTSFTICGLRCRARILGNQQRFAIALTIYLGRVPFSAENRVTRKAFLALNDAEVAGGYGRLEIKADNWAILTSRFPVMHAPTREAILVSLAERLGRLTTVFNALTPELSSGL